MPLYELAVPPADVCGTALRLALNAPAPTPLASVELPHPRGGALTLGVLGASHVVTVTHPEHTFSEEISCTAPNAAAGLPRQARHRGYRLRARTDILDETQFRALATWLRTNCTSRRGWVGGAFPGDDAALTALSARPNRSGWRWRTWHLYPDTDGGTVVSTSSRWCP
ncbi:DUF2617 family protein [Mycolicibacterium goodii]|uniref:DUF2617 family protein n=1 Tax=Mycolicibacterium goodii TaxID=134601 RepID=A0ABS6HR84_MYCGD|nr:DUF2617 family protein [Mycolicibacterium goodii]MBU8809684.1 DUF2617 family protein [Mycolicibacterium goodii]MBU8824718.1 DUF2617 family protein [Mycolicibacterium goodii]MBU8837304.1 DUF2617 family protein [Mycolicibacterium goodii]